MNLYICMYFAMYAFTIHRCLAPLPPTRDDDLKMRLELLILFAHADKDRFSDKPTLSARADNCGFL